MSVIISGFSDEIADELEEQVRVVKSLGMDHISLRGIDGKNVGEYSYEEFLVEVYPRLEQNGIKVSSIGSPIGKVFIEDQEGFDKQVLALEELCKIANLLQCQYIRMFSFFIDKDKDFDDYKDEVVEKLRKFIEIAEKYQVVLLHENEKDIYGDIARRCHTLFTELESDYFKGIFDFANFVQCKEDTMEAYELLREHIEYIHIKDAKYTDSYNVLCGTGDGRIEEILTIVMAEGYEGFMTLEPHLALFGSLKDIELDEGENVISRMEDLTGEEGYKLQYEALKEILEKVGA